MSAPPQPRILIVKLSSLGDLFHALPTVHALKTGLNARIDWAVQPEYAQLLRYFTDVETIHIFPRRNPVRQLPAFIRSLRQIHYDFVIDLQGLFKSAIITAASRGHMKIGPSATREGARLFYRQTAGRKNKQRHAVDELMDAVRFLNLPVPETPEFPVTFPDYPLPETGLRIAICPFSRAAGKDWPPERFAQLATELVRQKNATVYLVGGPGDREGCEKIARDAGPGVSNMAGKTSLPELGGLLQKMQLVITVDSGPMHVAAAVGTPTLALFGPTAPLRTGPYGKIHRVIESPFQTREKHISRKTRQNDLRYMQAIPAATVIQTALEMLRCCHEPAS